MVAPSSTIKFLCSYGGKILPRHPDGKLRYHGGHTRVLSVNNSVSFSELLLKMTELCGNSVSLRCQLPTEDLDALVTITSDEDLANLIEEYDRAGSSLKIRAFLFPPKSNKRISSPPSSTASSSSSSSSSVTDRCYPPQMTTSTPVVYKPPCFQKKIPRPVPHYPHHYGHGNQPHHQGHHGGHVYLVHNGNHWQ